MVAVCQIEMRVLVNSAGCSCIRTACTHATPPSSLWSLSLPPTPSTRGLALRWEAFAGDDPSHHHRLQPCTEVDKLVTVLPYRRDCPCMMSDVLQWSHLWWLFGREGQEFRRLVLRYSPAGQVIPPPLGQTYFAFGSRRCRQALLHLNRQKDVDFMMCISQQTRAP